jgi:uncharacterized protein DUF4238
MTGIPKVQHYVPRFLLRNHASGKKDQLWAFDKQTRREFRSAVKNLAAESRFYDFETPIGVASLEDALSRVESRARAIVQGLCRSRLVAGLSEHDRISLSLFLATQFLRTQAPREFQRDLLEALRYRFKDEQVGGELKRMLEDADEESHKTVALQVLASAPKYIPFFMDKFWILLEAGASDPFFLSDNPVALANQRDFKPMGNLGLGVPGIEIYLPIAPNLTLGMLCQRNWRANDWGG